MQLDSGVGAIHGLRSAALVTNGPLTDVRVKHLSNERRRTDRFGPPWPSHQSPNPLYSQAFRGIIPYQPNGANQAHNPKVAGSNPAPATQKRPSLAGPFFFHRYQVDRQLARGCHPGLPLKVLKLSISVDRASEMGPSACLARRDSELMVARLARCPEGRASASRASLATINCKFGNRRPIYAYEVTHKRYFRKGRWGRRIAIILRTKAALRLLLRDARGGVPLSVTI